MKAWTVLILNVLLLFLEPFNLMLVHLCQVMLGIQVDSISCEYGVLHHRIKGSFRENIF